jgi:hypothetical protein
MNTVDVSGCCLKENREQTATQIQSDTRIHGFKPSALPKRQDPSTYSNLLYTNNGMGQPMDLLNLLDEILMLPI